MYKAIKPDNAIFMTQEFQKDKYKFHVILKKFAKSGIETI